RDSERLRPTQQGRTSMNVQALRGHGWLGLVAALALGALVRAAPLRAADPGAPSPLTEEQRSPLDKEAGELYQRSFQLYQQRRYAEATKALKQVVEMLQRLYPADKYPEGHPDLAQSLGNLGTLLKDQGEYGQALGYFKRALEMRQRLYPADQYPQGHPELA